MRLKLLALLLLATIAAASAQPLRGCRDKCGNVSIPYPFGVGDKCFLEESFNLKCTNDKLYYGNLEILSISLEGHMDIYMYVSQVCDNTTESEANDPFLKTAAFTISSTANKFYSVGCDTYGYLNTFRGDHTYTTGCLSRCDESPTEELNVTSCSGIGCCQVDIPPRMRNITFQAYSFHNFAKVRRFNNCSFAFVAKQGFFQFSQASLRSLPFNMSKLEVDWNVQNPHVTCESTSTAPKFPCAPNSHCHEPDDGSGYRCKCKRGYSGNPYHPEGCNIDINECNDESAHNCISKDNCRNDPPGSFTCYCPPGYHGNGTKEGGCRELMPNNPLIKVLIGASAGLVSTFVAVSWLYLVYQKRKLVKQKDKLFLRNGGLILQLRLSSKETSSQTAKIFTSEELKKATNNYHESLIIGRGGFGIVYKGYLSDNKIVAMKKSKVVDQSQVEQFINEVVVLSQINHRNVVKLLGCCLETEVPLLVYEFVNNGTLFDYIKNKSKASIVSWEIRLRIAAEAAGALSYLHSAASVPIIHRDVKSSNILLDESYTAKVSDFGASRLVPLDQTELATMVQGTLGYLDPEYMQTNQLTEKSDVYSFGVVLVELLTGKKALSFDRPEQEQSLAMHFLSSLNRGLSFEVLEVGIANDENKEMLKEVIVLSERCLRLRGEERPSMKEVAMELEGMRMIGKHSWVNGEPNLEETQSLLGETSGISECVDSIDYRKTGRDSITDHVLINLDDGR